MSARPWTWLVVVLTVAFLIALSYRDRLAPPTEQADVLRAPAKCDPQREPCVARGAGGTVTLRFPDGARLMQPFAVEVEVGGAQVSSVSIDFAMRGMDMGVNEFRLEAAAHGLWRANALLPVCSTGRADWIATVSAQTSRGPLQAAYPFSVSP